MKAKAILIMCKDDHEVFQETIDFIIKLDNALSYSLAIYVDTKSLLFDPILISKCQKINFVEADQIDYSTLPIDLVIAIGGDGTVLHAAWRFQIGPVPPILPVYLKGTLGFLTVWDLDSCLNLLLSSSGLTFPSISNRMRLCCELISADNNSSHEFHVLNEIVVDRGAFGGLLQLELATGSAHNLLSNISADGIIISTPTGSTAYSMSAGGPIIHPDVEAILVTPICAHTLSFRPLVLPSSGMLSISLAETFRSDCAWVSFDGRDRIELGKRDRVLIRASEWPVPLLSSSFTSSGSITEWFECISARLHWNNDTRSKRSRY